MISGRRLSDRIKSVEADITIIGYSIFALNHIYYVVYIIYH